MLIEYRMQLLGGTPSPPVVVATPTRKIKQGRVASKEQRRRGDQTLLVNIRLKSVNHNEVEYNVMGSQRQTLSDDPDVRVKIKEIKKRDIVVRFVTMRKNE